MSSIGVGLTVFLGFVMSVPFVRPEVTVDVLLTGSMLWGLIVGFVYRMYEIALAGMKPPSFGR